MSDTPRTVNAIIERIRKEVAHSEAASGEGCIGCTHVMLRNEDAMALIGALSKGSKWIPVGTPPAEGAHVLVLHENGDIQDAYRRHTWAGGFTTARSQDGGGVSVEHVTHWMPLPAPPCDRCGDTGLVTLFGVPNGIGFEMDADDQPCPECQK